MARYQEVSEEIFGIFERFTPLVEPVSIDEAFLDVTGSARLFGEGREIAGRIKEMVRAETGLTVSAGVAPTKFVAKIASDLQKPDGLTVVPPEGVSAFLAPLPIGRLWGVGAATQRALEALGVRTIGDLGRIPAERLEARFGKHGVHLHQLSMGVDPRPVEVTREVKSVGREETFSEDLADGDAIRRELLALAMAAARRLRRKGVRGRTVTLKVRYADFSLITRATTLPRGVDDGGEIFRCCCGLLEKTAAGQRPVRLLGVSLSNLETAGGQRQPSLFGEDQGSQRQGRLNRALDRIQERFGEGAIRPGTLLEG
jgi:DNA polymerase-4